MPITWQITKANALEVQYKGMKFTCLNILYNVSWDVLFCHLIAPGLGYFPLRVLLVFKFFSAVLILIDLSHSSSVAVSSFNLYWNSTITLCHHVMLKCLLINWFWKIGKPFCNFMKCFGRISTCMYIILNFFAYKPVIILWPSQTQLNDSMYLYYLT